MSAMFVWPLLAAGVFTLIVHHAHAQQQQQQSNNNNINGPVFVDADASRTMAVETCIRSLVRKCTPSDRDLYKTDPRLAEARIRQEPCARELAESGWMKQLCKDDVTLGLGTACRNCASNRPQDILSNLALCLGRGNINCCSCLFQVRPPQDSQPAQPVGFSSDQTELSRRDAQLTDLFQKVNNVPRNPPRQAQQDAAPTDADQIIAEAVKNGIQSALGSLQQPDLVVGAPSAENLISRVAKQFNSEQSKGQLSPPDLAKLLEFQGAEIPPQPLLVSSPHGPPTTYEEKDTGKPAEETGAFNLDELMKNILGQAAEQQQDQQQQQPETQKPPAVAQEEPATAGLDLSSILGMLDAQSNQDADSLSPDQAADILKDLQVPGMMQDTEPATEPATKAVEEPAITMPDLSSLLNFGDSTVKIQEPTANPVEMLGTKLITTAAGAALDSAPLMRTNVIDVLVDTTMPQTETTSTITTTTTTTTTESPSTLPVTNAFLDKKDTKSEETKPESIAHEALNILRKLGTNPSANISKEEIQNIVNKLESVKPDLKSTQSEAEAVTTTARLTSHETLPAATTLESVVTTPRLDSKESSEEQVVTVIEYITDEPEETKPPRRKPSKLGNSNVEDIAKEAADERFATKPPRGESFSSEDGTESSRTRPPTVTGEAGEVLNEVLQIPFDKSLAANVGKSPFSPQRIRLPSPARPGTAAGGGGGGRPRLAGGSRHQKPLNKAKIAASQAADDVVQDLKNGNSYIQDALGDPHGRKSDFRQTANGGKHGSKPGRLMGSKPLSWNRHKEPMSDDHRHNKEPHGDRYRDPQDDRRGHRPRPSNKEEDVDADYFERLAETSQQPPSGGADYADPANSQKSAGDYEAPPPSYNQGPEDQAGYEDQDFDYNQQGPPRTFRRRRDHNSKHPNRRPAPRFKRETKKQKSSHGRKSTKEKRSLQNEDNNSTTVATVGTTPAGPGTNSNNNTNVGSSSSSSTVTTSTATWQTIADNIDAVNFTAQGSHAFEDFKAKVAAEGNNNRPKVELINVLNGTATASTEASAASTTTIQNGSTNTQKNTTVSN